MTLTIISKPHHPSLPPRAFANALRYISVNPQNEALGRLQISDPWNKVKILFFLSDDGCNYNCSD